MVKKWSSTLWLAVLVLIVLWSRQGVASDDNAAPKRLNNALPQVFTIGIRPNAYPAQFVNQQGQADGILKEFWQLWAQKQQVNIVFKAISWQTVQQPGKGLASATSSPKVDFHAGVVISANQADQQSFSDTLYPFDSFIYFHKDLDEMMSLNQLTPYKLGVVKGLTDVSAIFAANDKITPIYFDSREQMYQAALNREVLAFVELDTFNEQYDRITELQVLFPKFSRINYHTTSYAARLPAANEALLAFINQGLAKISLTERANIEKKWRMTSSSEQALNLGFIGTLPPYMSYSDSGQPQGLLIDIWRLWSKYTGRDINFVGDSLPRSLTQLVRGNTDIHIAYTNPVDDLDQLTKAAKVYSAQSHVFVSNRLPEVSSLEQLTGKSGWRFFIPRPMFHILIATMLSLNCAFFMIMSV